MAIKIVIDSASDIVLSEAEKLGVHLIPMEITFGDKTYLDGVNLTHKRFFELLSKTDKIPTTSQINEYRFEEVFSSLTEDNSSVLCITMSSNLSGTYERAVKASKKFNGKVVVVDSKNVAFGERLLLELAVKLNSEGKSLSEIADILNQQKTKIRLFAYVDTLKYLQKGGRISAATAAVGGLFNIKPIISIIDGCVKIVGKALGAHRAHSIINKHITDGGGIDLEMPFFTGYSGNDASNLEKYLSDSKDIFGGIKNIRKYMIGSTIGTHIGPGAVGVGYFAKT